MLATTLFVILIAMLMTTTLVAMNRQTILFTAGANDRAAALEMAQSGLNRVIDRWGTNQAFSSTLKYEDKDHRRSYSIAFGDVADVDKSYNNLGNDSPAGNVPAHSARVVVTGVAGSVTKRIRCIVSRSLFPVGKPVNAAEQYVTINGDFTLNGIKNPRDEVGVDKVKSGLHTNLSGTSGLPAMGLGPSGTAHVEETSILSAVTARDPSGAFNANLKSALSSQPDALKPDQSRIQLARNDVPKVLAEAEGTATELVLPLNDTDPVFVFGNAIIGKADGPPVHTGPIQLLGDATLYVRGGLVTPLIRGKGSIVSGGNVNVTQGARMVMANAGISLVAQGDIRFHGTPPDTSVLQQPAAAEFVDTIQRAVKEGLNDNSTTDAQEATQGLLSYVSSQPNPDQALVDTLQDLNQSLTLFHAVAASEVDALPTEKKKMVALLVADTDSTSEQSDRFEQFVNNNRLGDIMSPDFGRGHFQGLAFAGGNLVINGAFRVIGGVEARQNMALGQSLGDRTELTYCEAYRNLCPAGLGSPFLVSYQEE